MIELTFADEGCYACTAQDEQDYAVMQVEGCDVYAIMSYSEIEGCLIHGMYNTYDKACKSLMQYCDKGLFLPEDNVTKNIMECEYTFPDGVRDVADFIDTVWRYGGTWVE